jgi:hypothetical protein
MRAHHTAPALAIFLLLTGALPAQGAPAQRTHGPDPVQRLSSPTARVAGVSDWCANTDPSANQLDNGRSRYRAIYVYPADRPSRLATIGGQLQEGAFGASALLEEQYGRAIRFDIGTPCGADQLDITAVRLPFTYAQLATFAAANGTATFYAIAAALRRAGIPVAPNQTPVEALAALRENYLVWLDGPAPAQACGQGTAMLDSTRSQTNLNNYGGKLALIYRRGGGFCGAESVRHEIGHNLGALQPDAPHSEDGAHCNDAIEDTMCGSGSPQVASGAFNGLFFDYGNDDYWDPPNGRPLGWWTVNLSRFLCPGRNCNRPAPTPTIDRAAGEIRQFVRGARTARRARCSARRTASTRVQMAAMRLIGRTSCSNR